MYYIADMYERYCSEGESGKIYDENLSQNTSSNLSSNTSPS